MSLCVVHCFYTNLSICEVETGADILCGYAGDEGAVPGQVGLPPPQLELLEAHIVNLKTQCNILSKLHT